MARTYEVYHRMKKIFHLSIFLFPRENKHHMFKPTCVFLLLHRYECFILQCPKQRNDVSDIFTSEDMENMLLESRM